MLTTTHKVTFHQHLNWPLPQPYNKPHLRHLVVKQCKWLFRPSPRAYKLIK